jgi:hypothetical protein
VLGEASTGSDKITLFARFPDEMSGAILSD